MSPGESCPEWSRPFLPRLDRGPDQPPGRKESVDGEGAQSGPREPCDIILAEEEAKKFAPLCPERDLSGGL